MAYLAAGALGVGGPAQWRIGGRNAQQGDSCKQCFHEHAPAVVTNTARLTQCCHSRNWSVRTARLAARYLRYDNPFDFAANQSEQLTGDLSRRGA